MSRRITKQLVYGFLYLVLFSLIGAGAYVLFLRPAPTCYDKIKNQDETSVDCGGVCSAVCLDRNIRPIERVDKNATVLFPADRRVTLIEKVQNPNADFAADRFGYRFDLYGEGGAVVKTVRGESFIYSGEVKYLSEFVDIEADKKIVRSEAVIDEPHWVPAKGYERPVIQVGSFTTTAATTTVIVTGKITNKDVFAVPRVAILALFKNGTGVVVGASRTEIERLAPGGSRLFTILHPPLREIDSTKTEITAFGERP